VNTSSNCFTSAWSRYVKIIEDYSGAQINFVRERQSGPDRTNLHQLVNQLSQNHSK